jgi:tetratricopeptide (TPR) repeat protein/predicted Ser/Thr protein kinase
MPHVDEPAAVDLALAPTGAEATLAQALARTGAAFTSDPGSFDASGPADPLDDAAPLERLGRYRVLERLGAGGMGVVYVAYDPELDRKVAVKVIRGRADDEARTRLLREAQAMARLSHPNVVAVHDVGVLAEAQQVFLAMELVRGESLGAWMSARPRGWREVLARFIPAGRGLAAAHDAGLVHRDFKPDNVLLDGEGRARVTDFGLARAAGPASPADAAPSNTRPVVLADPADNLSSALSAPLTRVGTAVGTPAYMAPEQHLGLTVDARTDQFAFCASLYQALYGQIPFAGRTLLEYVDSVLAGRVLAPPRGRKVPGFVHRAVHRGLAPDPTHRFPDMHAMLAALGRDPARLRRRVLTGTLLLALGAGGAAALLAGPDPCSDAEAYLAGAWDHERSAAVAAALRATGLTYAEETWSLVQGHLDLYAGTWSRMHTDVCLAHRRGEVSDELLDLTMACLAGRRERLAALVQVLAVADAAVVEHAVQAAAGLPGLDRCGDPRALRTGVSPPPLEQVDAVARVRGALARAAAEEDAGRYAAGAAIADIALADARALDYRPLVGEVLLRRGALAKRSGEPQAARDLLTDAWRAGLAARHDEVAAEAAVEQIGVVGRALADLEGGLRWAGDAQALLDRGDRGDAMTSRYFQNVGNMYLRAGKIAEALGPLRRAVELREAALGAADPAVADARTSLGEALRRQGDFAAAAAAHEQALRDTIAAYGPSHPMVAVARNNLGIAYGWLGRHADAVAEHEAAAAIRERALGPDHPQLASSHTNLATALIELGRFDDAERHLLHAIEILTARGGPRAPDLSDPRSNLGNVYYAQGRVEEALAAYDEALAIDAAQFGDDSLDAAISRNNVGAALWQLGRRDEAERELRRALAAMEQHLGPAHPHVAFPLLGLGGVLLDAHRPADARALLTRARDLAAKQDSPGLRAALRSELAQADAALAGAAGLPAARAEVEAARNALAAAGPLFASLRRRADAFLARPMP